tara:strand:+ start:901 stop:1230 length:330 start_codon:yes stop_codon:yes gene_type:complete
MIELFSNGMNRSYDDFRKEIDLKVHPLMDLLRKFCFTLGSNVVEDVRMHRVVFSKSFVLRWFVDVEPQNDSILLKIQKSRGEIQTVKLGIDQNLTNIQALIREAYDSIH